MTKNGKISIIALAVGFIACLAARTVGILSFTDMKTGFLVHGSEVAYCLIFYGVLAVCAVLTAVFAPKIAPGEEKLSAKGTTIIGAIMLVVSALAILDGFMNMNTPSPFMLIVIADFAGAAYIAAVGIITLLKKKITAGIGFMYSIVGVYFIIRGISAIAQRMVINGIQEYLLEALSVTMGGIFFALFGKVLSGNSEKRSLFFMRLWGSASAILTLSSAFGAIFAKFFGSAEISGRITADFAEAQRFTQENYMSESGCYMMSIMPYVNIAMGIFAAVGVILSLKKQKN